MECGANDWWGLLVGRKPGSPTWGNKGGGRGGWDFRPNQRSAKCLQIMGFSSLRSEVREGISHTERCLILVGCIGTLMSRDQSEESPFYRTCLG
jgi:hypothetical protein